MTTVLITGISGSIGCHVFQHVMRKTDFDVIGIGSFRHGGMTDRIEAMLRAHPEDRSRLRMFVHDLRVPISKVLMARMGRVDFIINLAALSDVGASLTDPGAFIVGNTQMMLNVLDYARAEEPHAFLHVSTDEVYGPQIAGRDHPEWDAILPSSPYSASKAAQEAAAICYWRSFRVPLILVNMSNNIGEMQSPAKFPMIIQRKLYRREHITVHAAADGSIGSRHYLHSRNAADAFLFILRRGARQYFPHSDYQPDRFNLAGNSGDIPNDELVWTIADMMGVAPDFAIETAESERPGYDPHYGLDGTKLTDLGWTPPTSFIDSLAATIRWHRENPEWL